MARVTIALAQLNTLVGDLAGNAAKVLHAAQKAHAQGADVLVTPELALTGYPPEDLLLRPAFIQMQAQALAKLQAQLATLQGLHVVLGHVQWHDGRLHNAASVLLHGQCLGTYHKQHLPNYGVFDELRYFAPGARALVFEVKTVAFGVNICEDLWLGHTAAQAREYGAQALLVLNASPYTLDKAQERLQTLRRHADGLPLIYVNQIGGQDELVFDGASFAMDTRADVTARLPAFEEAIGLVSLDADYVPRPVDAIAATPWPDRPAQVWQALVLALRDYVRKTGFTRVLLGLSGGIDSAVVLALAVDALGADKVSTVMMPSRYTAEISLADARQMAQGLRVAYREIPISPMVDAFETALQPAFAGLPADATEENIQARVRGNLLMALSNKTGALVLTTGNRSELATGYCTLYGDMAGAFALLKDVPKTLVYALARWRNAQSPAIPTRIIERPPSAELRPDQTDQDSLPPYDVLDDILARHMQDNASAADIIAAGHAPALVERVLRMVRINEYKRRQGAIGPNVTTRAFGRGWRMPIAHGFLEPNPAGSSTATPQTTTA